MFTKLYLIALPVFIVLDLLWVGVVANKFYKSQIGFLFKNDVNWIAVFVFYLIFIAGIVTFVLLPNIQKNTLLTTGMYGLLFGIVTYATYDLVNLATVKNWPILVTVVDIAWGGVVCGLVSIISYIILKKI